MVITIRLFCYPLIDRPLSFINILLADYGKVFDLQPSKVYQVIEGFGGAATDAAGINWKKMKPAIQDTLVK